MTLCKKLSVLGALWVILCGGVQADIKLRIRTTVNGRLEYETIYVQGERRRTEFSNRRKVARILHCDTRKAFLVDLDVGEYSELKWPWWPPRSELEKAAQKPKSNLVAKPQSAAEEPQTRTVDTGERKDIFGLTARRIVTTVKHPSWIGARSQPHREVIEDVTEGWYIDLPVGERCEPDYSFGIESAEGSKSGQPPFGLAMIPAKLVSTTRFRVFAADGTVREVTSHFEREIVELSEEPLAPALFEVPVGFKKARRIEVPN